MEQAINSLAEFALIGVGLVFGSLLLMGIVQIISLLRR